MPSFQIPSAYIPPPPAPPPTFYDDTFDLKQACKDYWAQVRNPNRYFEEQVISTGYRSTLMLMLLSWMTTLLTMIVSFPFDGLSVLFHFPMEVAYYTLIPFIVAGLCHLIGRAFGNKVGFSASLRAVVGAGVQSGFVALVVCAILSFISFNVAAVTTPDFLSETNRSHIGVDAGLQTFHIAVLSVGPKS